MNILNSKNLFSSQPLWQQVLIVIIFNSLIALLLSRVSVNNRFVDQLIISQCIGLSIAACYLLFVRFYRLNVWNFLLPLAAGIAIGIFLTWIISGMLSGLGWDQIPATLQRRLHSGIANDITTIGIAVFFGIIILYYFVSREHLLKTNAALQQERLESLEQQRQISETRLRLLQAQIEPHFLFNTLSNIAGLIASDGQKAQTMLENLTRYLRSTLTRSQDKNTSLQDELELLENYLDIFRVRMGERLAYSIDVDESLRGIALPPLLLQPLVENAIKHGLEPAVKGGKIQISATRMDACIRIAVTDNGMGLQQETSSGMGLANIRERLRSLYGDAARLVIEANHPTGVRASIEIPDAD